MRQQCLHTKILPYGQVLASLFFKRDCTMSVVFEKTTKISSLFGNMHDTRLSILALEFHI